MTEEERLVEMTKSTSISSSQRKKYDANIKYLNIYRIIELIFMVRAMKIYRRTRYMLIYHATVHMVLVLHISILLANHVMYVDLNYAMKLNQMSDIRRRENYTRHQFV